MSVKEARQLNATQTHRRGVGLILGGVLLYGVFGVLGSIPTQSAERAPICLLGAVQTRALRR